MRTAQQHVVGKGNKRIGHKKENRGQCQNNTRIRKQCEISENAGFDFCYPDQKKRKATNIIKRKGANSLIYPLQISLVFHFHGAHPAIIIEKTNDEIININLHY